MRFFDIKVLQEHQVDLEFQEHQDLPEHRERPEFHRATTQVNFFKNLCPLDVIHSLSLFNFPEYVDGFCCGTLPEMGQ